MATAAGTTQGGMPSASRMPRSRQRVRQAAAPARRPSSTLAPPADPLASIPRLRGKLRLPRLARARREWATSARRYTVRVGWRRARVSDNTLGLLALIDGSRSIRELAVEHGAHQGRFVHPAEVLYLLHHRLLPAGLVALKAGAPTLAAPSPALSSPSLAGAMAAPEPAGMPALPVESAPDLNTRTAMSASLASSASSAAPAAPDTAVTQPLLPLVEDTPPPPLAPAPLPSDFPTLPVVPLALLDDERGGQAQTAPLEPPATPPAPPTPPALSTLSPPATQQPAARPTRPAPVAYPPPVAYPAPVRRQRPSAAVRVVLAILGLAFLLGALLAALSLSDRSPIALTQPTVQPTHAPTATSTPLRERLLPGERAYVVRTGDTLAAIAKQTGISPAALLIANADVLPSESALRPGMQLAIPAIYNPRLAPDAQPRPLYYVVQRGDTLYDIGVFFGTTWNAIADYNKLPDPRALTVGQGLLIPPAGAPSPPR